jgi:hypothetical protein
MSIRSQAVLREIEERPGGCRVGRRGWRRSLDVDGGRSGGFRGLARLLSTRAAKWGDAIWVRTTRHPERPHSLAPPGIGPKPSPSLLDISGAVMIAGLEHSEPGVTTTDRSPPLPPGTWAIDPANSGALFAWRRLRRWTGTGRLHTAGVIHLDELPPVGVIRFHQPSGLPVLTMTLDPASLETGAADLDAMGAGPDLSGPGGGPSAARAWRSCPPEPGGSWPPSPPEVAQAWSSCTSRPTPRPAAATGWCCADGGCWIDGPSAWASGPRFRPRDPTGAGRARHPSGNPCQHREVWRRPPPAACRAAPAAGCPAHTQRHKQAAPARLVHDDGPTPASPDRRNAPP